MTATTLQPREDKASKAIGLMLFAYVCFTGLDSSAKFLGQSLPLEQIVFMRYAVHLAIMSALVVPFYKGPILSSAAPRSQVFRALMLLAMTLFNFAAVTYLPLAVTGSILFAAPLIVAALSMPLLGERVGPRRWAAIVVGFLGVLIIIRPGVGIVHWAVLLSLGAALTIALYQIWTRKLAGVDSTETSQFYVGLVATTLTAPFAVLAWQWPQDVWTWVFLFLCGVFGYTGHQALTVAYRYAPAATLAPFVYVSIIYMTISGYVFFDDRPDGWVFVGAAVVAASGLYIWWRERQVARAV